MTETTTFGTSGSSGVVGRVCIAYVRGRQRRNPRGPTIGRGRQEPGQIAGVPGPLKHIGKHVYEKAHPAVLAHLGGEISEEEARRQVVVGTRRFARRQDAWFRKDDRIRWVAWDDADRVERAGTAVSGAASAERR